MTNKREHISVYSDDEASEFEAVSALKQLKQDASLRRRWESYHLIGDAIRHNLSAVMPVGFTERLSLALEREPTYGSSRPTPYQRVNDTAGFALAASVSAVAIVGLLQFGTPAMLSSASSHYDTDIQQQYNTPTTTAGQNNRPTIDIAAAVNMDNQALADASFDGDRMDQITQMASTAGLESSIYDYLVDFSQYAVAAPLDGSIPVVNLASSKLY